MQVILRFTRGIVVAVFVVFSATTIACFAAPSAFGPDVVEYRSSFVFIAAGLFLIALVLGVLSDIHKRVVDHSHGPSLPTGQDL